MIPKTRLLSERAPVVLSSVLKLVLFSCSDSLLDRTKIPLYRVTRILKTQEYFAETQHFFYAHGRANSVGRTVARVCLGLCVRMYIPWRVRILAVDLSLLCAAGVIALLLRENLTLDIQKLTDIAPYVLFIVTLAVPVNLTLGLDRAVWRFAVFSDFMRVMIAVCLTVVSATILTFLFNRMEGISRSLPIIQILISIFALVGVRLVVRAWFQAASHEGSPPSLAPIETNMRAECVLIIGVNRLAVLLLKAMAEPCPDFTYSDRRRTCRSFCARCLCMEWRFTGSLSRYRPS
jgi:hypothetical protein